LNDEELPPAGSTTIVFASWTPAGGSFVSIHGHHLTPRPLTGLLKLNLYVQVEILGATHPAMIRQTAPGSVRQSTSLKIMAAPELGVLVERISCCGGLEGES